MSNAIEEKCKKKGVRLTDQRRVIAKVMSESDNHPVLMNYIKKLISMILKLALLQFIEL